VDVRDRRACGDAGDSEEENDARSMHHSELLQQLYLTGMIQIIRRNSGKKKDVADLRG
jgi:hypothetical protein